MSIFRSNYKKLVQENKYGLAEISGKSFKALDSMFDYLSTYDISLFEMEVIKKDLIGLAKEADMEGSAFLDKIGMPEKVFCDSLVKDGMKSDRFGRFIPLMRDLLITDWMLYTIYWLLEGTPETFGIPTYFFIVNAGLFLWEYLVTLKLQRKKAEHAMAKNKKEVFYKLLLFLATFTFVMQGWMLAELPEFIMRGTGSVIFFVLLVLSVAAFFGNNYYWDKCSEKYNWR